MSSDKNIWDMWIKNRFETRYTDEHISVHKQHVTSYIFVVNQRNSYWSLRQVYMNGKKRTEKKYINMSNIT